MSTAVTTQARAIGARRTTARRDLPNPLFAPFAWLQAYLQRRRAIAHLEELSDAQLRDIGVDRRDIRRVVTEGLG